MPKPAKGPRLGSGPDHERLILGGLASALIRDERIRTTEAKAKRLRPVAERLITLGKDGSVHARRRALQMIQDRDVVHKLFDEVAPRFVDRVGGYTRILKLGPRKGDAAPMALIELVETEVVAPKPAEEESEGRRRRLGRRRRAAAPAQESVQAEPEEPVEEPVIAVGEPSPVADEIVEEAAQPVEASDESVKVSEDAATVEDVTEKPEQE